MRQAVLMLTSVWSLSSGVVLDRIAVIVGKHVIKTSDIDRELRVTQFLNREQPNFSAGAKRKAAERLIDQDLIRNQLASGGYSRATDSDAEGLLKQIRQSRFGSSEVLMREALSRYGLTDEQLQAHLLWQLTVLRFIDQRFRPAVLVTDEDVHNYYVQHLNDLKREHPNGSGFETLEPRIRTLLEGQRINQEFETWLDGARKRARIEYREEAFQ